MDDSYAAPNEEAFELLKLKHPSVPADRRSPPAAPVSPFQCNVAQMMKAICSFRPGSSPRPNGLRPQHVLDMVQASDDDLVQHLVAFANMVLAGGVPKSFVPRSSVHPCTSCQRRMEGCVPLQWGALCDVWCPK